MKKILLYLPALALLNFIHACKKTDTVIIPPDFKSPNGSCIMAKTSDASGFQVFGELNFEYDAKGNPSKLNGVITFEYDAKGRLESEKSSHYDVSIIYHDDSFLPSVSYRYHDNVLIQTLIYTYDDAGRVIKTDKISVNNSGGYKTVWEYSYDAKNNIQTIIDAVTKDIVFKAKSYDDKPNFLSGNQWIKYILFDEVTAGYYPLNFSIFSANNVTEWSINDQATGLIYDKIDTYYEYNDKGYAVKDSIVFRDPVDPVNDFGGVQTTVFICN